MVRRLSIGYDEAEYIQLTNLTRSSCHLGDVVGPTDRVVSAILLELIAEKHS